MNASDLYLRLLHPYIGRAPIGRADARRRALTALNAGRDNSRGAAVEATYYFEVAHRGKPMEGLAHAARMVLEHGTLKSWAKEGDAACVKPCGYDEFMSWATDIALLAHDAGQGLESGLVTIAYPLRFFDKRADGKPPLAQLLMAIASEPFSAFSFLRGARIVDIRLPAALRRRFPGQSWSHRRIREYLALAPDEPIIGTIVKPKTGLTPELFSRCIVEAAVAGARFTKADENMHLTIRELPRYVGRVVKDLRAHGFDLSREGRPKGPRFLFAPHITTDADQLRDYARAALDAGANALMFSPYYAGGFPKMAEIVEEFDVPVYAHTAGMNVFTGSSVWGLDPRVTYLFAGLYGAAFMQLTTMGGYLKPDDPEKGEILRCLRANGLDGDRGMTLAIAGGMGPANIGRNMKLLGRKGRMFLAGTSVYSHPDGPGAGVQAMRLAYGAYVREGLEDEAELRRYARDLGAEGTPLLHALGG
ncbi:MAG: RuBisCO large subunit C-terminal-like domain-containing protein [Kiritimatiellae bacterium]|nr:RuBisCO large subunit C-terminal-like domain-containing protein [Kiritimatiellia bacterium]